MSRRIGITQRVEEIAFYGERRDCLDQQWFVLLESLGFTPVPIPNRLQHTESWLGSMGLDGFILSGGNDLAHLPSPSRPAPERDETERSVLSYARVDGIPVLGVCRGLQMMTVYLGGFLVPVQGHTAVRHPVRAVGGDSRWSAYREVNSFHDWALPPEGLGEGLQACLRTDGGHVEAVCHEHLNWLGIMWHPEREAPFTEHDRDLISQLFGGNA